MNRVAFENYLNNYVRSNGAHLTASAILTRLRKAEEAESVLHHSLDVTVGSDAQMKADLVGLRTNNAHELRYGQMQNAVRKYYHMIHGHWFPRLKNA